MKTSNIVIFQLDSDKQSFGLDNVPKFIRFEAAIVKIQCFENQHKLKKIIVFWMHVLIMQKYFH